MTQETNRTTLYRMLASIDTVNNLLGTSPYKIQILNGAGERFPFELEEKQPFIIPTGKLWVEVYKLNTCSPSTESSAKP